MNYEKRLVNLFKNFVDRLFGSILRTQQKLLKEWLYFSTLVSQDFIDYGRVEKYVQSLMGQSTQLQTTSSLKVDKYPMETTLPDYDGFLKKKQEIVDKFKQQNTVSALHLSKTCGGERTPLSMIGHHLTPSSRIEQLPAMRDLPRENVVYRRLAGLLQKFEDNERKLEIGTSRRLFRTDEIGN